MGRTTDCGHLVRDAFHTDCRGRDCIRREAANCEVSVQGPAPSKGGPCSLFIDSITLRATIVPFDGYQPYEGYRHMVVPD